MCVCLLILLIFCFKISNLLIEKKVRGREKGRVKGVERGWQVWILSCIPSAFSLAGLSCDVSKHHSIDFTDL